MRGGAYRRFHKVRKVHHVQAVNRIGLRVIVRVQIVPIVLDCQHGGRANRPKGHVVGFPFAVRPNLWRERGQAISRRDVNKYLGDGAVGGGTGVARLANVQKQQAVIIAVI